MQTTKTVADVLAQVFARHGIRHVFGVPGGGSCIDLIDALSRCGIRFITARTEAAAAMMASASAEAGDAFGVVMATQGPGTASVINGVAHASLDRIPLLVITDGWSTTQAQLDTHQVFNQQAVMAPLVKATTRLESADVAAELEDLIALTRSAPWGPVYIELTGECARRPMSDSAAAARPITAPLAAIEIQSAAQALVAAAKKPVILLGLETRTPALHAPLRALAQAWSCPVLATYKAKGVVADDDLHAIGLFTGGAAEKECINQADLIVMIGLDPVELIGKPWTFSAPVLELSLRKHPVHYMRPEVALIQRLDTSIAALAAVRPAGVWQAEQLRQQRDTMRARMAWNGGHEGLTPNEVVEIAAQVAAPCAPLVSVDAGAHMFPAMALWPARAGSETLISNGLATMAYALPAGIGLALRAAPRRVIAFTGDGGLMMCAGELATAAQLGLPLCVVVFNDATLSLIRLKQESRKLPKLAVDGPRVDIAAIAQASGLTAYRADTAKEYRDALVAALALPGASLIDVRVDPSGYLALATSLRG